jgi:hypothetical protein
LREEGATVLLVTHELDEAGHCAIERSRCGTVTSSTRDTRRPYRPNASGLPLGSAGRVAQLRALPGVRDVAVEPARLTVHGNRQSIAHEVELSVPGRSPDLAVEMPNLEAALLPCWRAPMTEMVTI